MIKQILFDFFGVLTTPVYFPIIKKHIPKDLQEGFMILLDDFDLGKIKEEEFTKMISVASGVESYVIWNEVQNNPKINYELLDFMEEELIPNYKVGLLTNANRTVIERIIGSKLAIFDPLYISSDLGLIKPDKAIFEFVISNLKIEPKETLFIDDSEKNIEIAKSLDMETIQYADFEKLKKDLSIHVL